MADRSQLTRLTSAVEVWNDWYANQVQAADLAAADLTGEDLSGANLRAASLHESIFSRATLDDADFSEADLNYSVFYGSKMVRTIFDGAQLREAEIIDANLENSNLRGANLEGALVRNSCLVGADLSSARIVGADFSGSDMKGVDLSGATVYSSDFSESDLAGASLDEVRWDENTEWPPGVRPETEPRIWPREAVPPRRSDRSVVGSFPSAGAKLPTAEVASILREVEQAWEPVSSYLDVRLEDERFVLSPDEELDLAAYRQMLHAWHRSSSKDPRLFELINAGIAPALASAVRTDDRLGLTVPHGESLRGAGEAVARAVEAIAELDSGEAAPEPSVIGNAVAQGSLAVDALSIAFLGTGPEVDSRESDDPTLLQATSDRIDRLTADTAGLLDALTRMGEVLEPRLKAACRQGVRLVRIVAYVSLALRAMGIG